jgi:hypothetical protein
MHNQWKGFHLRNIMLAIQRKMSQNFNGDIKKMAEVTAHKISQLLDVNLKELKQTEHEAFSNFALVLSLTPNLAKWTKEEKELVVKIFHSKGSGREAHYLQLMQKHRQLRAALIKIGNSGL